MKSFDLFVNNYQNSNDDIEVLRDYVNSNRFQTDLKSLSVEELETIAKRSTIHSNDFKKIVLSTHNGYKLRLHIWNEKPNNQYHEPHDHRWDFKSYVLTGTMVNRIVEESNSKRTFLKYKSLPMVVGQKRTYEVSDPIGIKGLEDQIITEGEMYEMGADCIHIAKIPKNTSTSTLFVTSPAKKEFSNLYMPDLKNAPTEHRLPAFSVTELKETISNLLLKLVK